MEKIDFKDSKGHPWQVVWYPNTSSVFAGPVDENNPRGPIADYISIGFSITAKNSLAKAKKYAAQR